MSEFAQPAGMALSDDLQSTVRDVLGEGPWHLEPMPNSRTAFLATAGARRVFVKVDGNPTLVRRLGELGVAPPVVATRADAGGSMVIQELVVGVHPDPTWLDEHVVEACALISRYHADPGLAAGVPVLTAPDFVGLLAQRVAGLTVDVGAELRRQLAATLDALARSAVRLEPGEQCVTHGDPNTSNWIRAHDGRLYLVDWDEARVTDPVRDVGQLLWWYVRPERWSEALEAAGMSARPEVTGRVYWWAAAESLDVSLQHVEHGDDSRAGAFARDALAASRDELNPRAWYRSP